MLSGFVFFAWGEIYSLFPSTCTDTFGAKFATTNAGLLYTAKGTAALLVPIANYMQQSSGSWDNVFIIAAGANILASLLAIVGAQTLAQGRGRAIGRLTRFTALSRATPGLAAGRFRLCGNLLDSANPKERRIFLGSAAQDRACILEYGIPSSLLRLRR